MALIKQIQVSEKTQIRISATKELADKFNEQMAIYQKNNTVNTLDFDILVKKLVKELEQINNKK